MLTCINNNNILKRVSLKATFPVWRKRTDRFWNCAPQTDRRRGEFVVQTCTVKIVAPTIYFTVSEWQRWFSTMDSDTKQLRIWRFELTSSQTRVFYSPFFFSPFIHIVFMQWRKRSTFVLKQYNTPKAAGCCIPACCNLFNYSPKYAFDPSTWSSSPFFFLNHPFR